MAKPGHVPGVARGGHGLPVQTERTFSPALQAPGSDPCSQLEGVGEFYTWIYLLLLFPRKEMRKAGCESNPHRLHHFSTQQWVGAPAWPGSGGPEGTGSNNGQNH